MQWIQWTVEQPWSLSLLVFLIAFAFIASEKVDKTIAAVLGAAAVVVCHQVPYHEALEHIDLNVLFLLIGMMMVVNILASTGLFEWLAIWIAKAARGSGPLLLAMLVLVTAVLSAFLDNVTTIIIIAPITILICQLLEIRAIPFLALEAIFSNIGGTGTLVGDPPNIIIGSKSHLTFMDFMVHLGPIAIFITLVVGAIYLAVLRKWFAVPEHARDRLKVAEPARAILDRRRLRRGLAVLGLVFVAFFLSHALRIETGVIALAGGFLMCLVAKEDVHHALMKVEWNTILFFVGLFMLVGSLEHTGFFHLLGTRVLGLTDGNILVTAIAVLWFSAFFSAFLDNIPLVIATIPIIESMIPELAVGAGLEPGSHEALVRIGEPLYWSLALGACLGGNGSLIGASANVVVAQIARRNGYAMSFWDFMKLGFPAMLLSAAISTVYVVLRYF